MPRDDKFLAYKGLSEAVSAQSIDSDWLVPIYDNNEDIAYTATLTVVGNTVNQETFRTVASNTTLLSTDIVILVDDTAGDVTVTLPAISTVDPILYKVKKIAGGNTTTISPTGVQIDRSASKVITTVNNSWSFSHDNTEWWTL